MMPTVADLEGDVHPHLHALRATEPVAWVDAIGGWLVTRRDLALAVMRDDATFTVDDPRFSTAQVVGPSMLSTDGAAHARHRAPWARPFRLDAIREGLGPVVRDEATALLDELAPAGAGELRRGFAGPLAAATMRHVLGLQAASVAQVLEWYDAIVTAVGGVNAGRPIGPEAREAFAALSGAVGDDLADTGDLSRDEAVSNAAILLFGGIETTEGMIANALWHLLSHPDALARVRADPALLPGAVEESLRMEPAAAVVDRYATADAELGGARIARGDLVSVSVTGANRDPASFPEPDAFDPARPDARRHLTFAAGPHVCLGMHLARLECHTALALVLERLPGLRPAGDLAAMAPQGLVFRKPATLDLRWDAPPTYVR